LVAADGLMPMHSVPELLAHAAELGLHELRIAWFDLHGTARCKTLVLGPQPRRQAALASALSSGLGMVSTLLLKDTADRTAFAVFDGDAALAAAVGLPGGAGNVLLQPDLTRLHVLPWAPQTGWLRADVCAASGTPLACDPRQALCRATAALQAAGHSLHCGLEVEFHIYRISQDQLGASEAAWPTEPPEVRLLHPGWQLLGEAHANLAAEALQIVRHTALGLGLPLTSLEIEIGPSQFEAVFEPQPALLAADTLLLFRSAVRQALRRAGYHASFVCKPPLPGAVASGWHLHHSVVHDSGANAFALEPAAVGASASGLSTFGQHWLAGLLAHAPGMAALCAPTLPAYNRYQGSLMAPQAAVWAHDNRGAMLRVLAPAGGASAASTRIENRLPEPLANPYLCMAAHVWAGLDGVQRALLPPPPSAAPYAAEQGGTRLPQTLAEALDALQADAVLQACLGAPMARVFDGIKRQELARHAAAEQPEVWLRREYFGRY
jgi:glutamine synthetase